MAYNKPVDISVLVGKTITRIDYDDADRNYIRFFCDDGSAYQQVYHQDCCAGCDIESIVGDLGDLIGTPVLIAEEASFPQVHPAGVRPASIEYEAESFTWTFYKIDTNKGGITVRWYGSSNGYYSESATFEEVAQTEEEGA